MCILTGLFFLFGSAFIIHRVCHSTSNIFLEASLESLMEEEYTIFGHCKKVENACMSRCPECGDLFICTVLYAGPAYNIDGECPHCHVTIHID